MPQIDSTSQSTLPNCREVKASPTRPRFTLRTVMLAVTIAGLLLGWYANWRAAKVREYHAAEAFRQAGGEVYGEYGREFGRPGTKTWWQRGIAAIIPDECLFTARQARLQDFATDRLAERLPDMPQLRYVDLHSSEITGAALQHLANHRQVIELDLSFTAVDDAGLEHLRRLRSLQVVYLNHTQITDQSLPLLTNNRSLVSLNLDETAVTDQGVAALVGLPQLYRLSLGKTQITSRSISTLQTLPRLQHLSLWRTSLDDSAIPELIQLTNLQDLDLAGTRIGPAGLQYLRETLPQCKVRAD